MFAFIHFFLAYFTFFFSLQTSVEHLNMLLHRENNMCNQLDEELMELKLTCNRLTTQLTEVSTEVAVLQDEYNYLEKYAFIVFHYCSKEGDFVAISDLALCFSKMQESYTLRGLNFAGIKFRGSLHPRNFDSFAGI